MADKKTLLDVKDLSIIYTSRNETIHAVNGIDFNLQKGETLGIVGETGAGKSTTAYSILRLLPERTAKVTSGSIMFDDMDLLKISDGLMQHGIRGERISIIFQDPMSALNPIMRIGDQIAEALKFHNKENLTKEELEKQVDETLQLVGIQKERKDFSAGCTDFYKPD